jgi:quinoprotein glucose dehydrogenase
MLRRVVGISIFGLVVLLICTAVIGSGDVTVLSHGKAVFQRVGCADCHGTNGAASTDAPLLTGVSKRLSPEQLVRAVLDPSAELAPGFEQVTVVTSEGQVIAGRLVSTTATTATIETIDGGQVEVQGVGPTDVSISSPMPAIPLSKHDLEALVYFLRSLYTESAKLLAQ